ncbi:integrating conjugative element membrane protein%2C PFL_4702 family [Yersinia frederiksenii]|uniref:Integrating conjugative element membrane protein n=1 Tax=Yersinia intermedia TaxID=631 RepID=A0A208ZV20_YERIN|nr:MULTISPECIES: TIGR03745 family integrating conjugative element membrane protein [Yersiniaceae]EKN4829712.1 TIGR03745 family integrating conjugative element membrane protein [Yersinia enterocolitica]EKN4850953.1 TIGR03745 family integrating conjugative element membrane protein [Yersinia enterocolitica]ELI8278167.1 TIGR03745 family integrating conjugative element membrane protein [Yersinia enterocolitica]ELW8177120.1 TIGR03745 family integrating conjugative element membrane protein [Yersinia e
MNLPSLFSSARRVAQRISQSTLLLALTAVTSAHAALPTVEGPKSSTDSSFYGQISGYLNDGIVLGGLILAAAALLVVANAIIATFSEVQQGKSTWAKFGMLVVVGIVLVVAVIWLATKAATVIVG